MRSLSVDPRSKYSGGRTISNNTLDLDKAADQIIEFSLNQFRDEVQRDIEVKKSQQDSRDYLEEMYDDIGGRVFDINHELNTSNLYKRV